MEGAAGERTVPVEMSWRGRTCCSTTCFPPGRSQAPKGTFGKLHDGYSSGTHTLKKAIGQKTVESRLQ